MLWDIEFSVTSLLNVIVLSDVTVKGGGVFSEKKNKYKLTPN